MSLLLRKGTNTKPVFLRLPSALMQLASASRDLGAHQAFRSQPFASCCNVTARCVPRGLPAAAGDMMDSHGHSGLLHRAQLARACCAQPAQPGVMVRCTSARTIDPG